MELQWNSSKVIKTQETYNQLISYSKEQQSGYPVIIASLFYEKKNGDMFRVDLNIAGDDCLSCNIQRRFFFFTSNCDNTGLR